MKKRFVFIAALAFSFVFPVALSGLGLPAGEAMAQSKRYTVEVQGEWKPKGGNPGANVRRGIYESNALSAGIARTSAIREFKKDWPNYTKNVKATVKSSPAQRVGQSLGQKTTNQLKPLDLTR